MQASGTLYDHFTNFVRMQPTAPAVLVDGEVLSYAGLGNAAGKISAELLRLGLQPGEAVGVMVERSKDLPAAFLAILKAGGVYVPMVADHPADRLCSFARQAEIRILIVLDGIEPPPELLETLAGNRKDSGASALIRPETVPEGEDGRVSEIAAPARKGSDLAAILFTSGSTGTPKGVMITHKACLNMALGHCIAQAIGSGDRILLSTSPGFILGFRELCLPAAAGASWVAASRADIDRPEELAAFMGRHRVSIAMFTPSYLRLLDGTVPEGLRCVMTAGERPNAADARAYARRIEYWNIHGATEVCGTICMHRVDPDREGTIPSGRPFFNTAIHILDDEGNEVPEGEAGELFITGDGVSPGYLKQPELTARHFVQLRQSRAFRTYDLARINRQGELETIGRMGDAVKVSGQSVSLGEIEQALLRHPGVRRAVALQDRGMLFACVETPETDPAGSPDWRGFLGKRLPSYMIPARVFALAEMPMKSSGKADRSALLKLMHEFFESREGSPPSGATEQAIAGIWEELTGVRPIMREDNFFSIGGTSLIAIAVSQRLQELGHAVGVQAVLASMTVAALAGHIDRGDDDRASAFDNLAEGDIRATIDQSRFRIASELGMEHSAALIVRLFSVEGGPASPETWQECWNSLVDHHPALRSSIVSNESGETGWKTIERDPASPAWRLAFQRCDSRSEALTIVSGKTRKPFRLDEAPLVRAGIIEAGRGERELLFWIVIHHAVADGESVRLLVGDLVGLLEGRELPVAMNGLSVAGEVERRYLSSRRAEEDREFWEQRLDAIAASSPTAFDRYFVNHAATGREPAAGSVPVSEKIGSDTVASLTALARANGCGLHAILLALLAVETRRRLNPGGIIIGSGISVRPPRTETTVGHFVNLLPVVIEGDAADAFKTLLKNVQASLTETVAHAGLPSGVIHDGFRQRHPELRPSRPSLFDLALTAIPPRDFLETDPGNTVRLRSIPGLPEYPPAGLDLSISHELSPTDGSLVISAIRNPESCPESVAAATVAALAAWARWLAEDAGRADAPFPDLLPHEEAVLQRWENGPSVPIPDRRSHELFEALVDAQPNRLAVIGDDEVETRSELDAKANGLARRLADLGIGRGAVVAVLGSASAELPSTLLGIWKCGAAYLPLAEETPPRRLAGICADAGARVLVVLNRLEADELLAAGVAAVVRPEECPPERLRPCVAGSSEDIAYIIYTSGTTGMPKGVPVSHKAFANAVAGVACRIGLRDDDRTSLTSTIGFDASLIELGFALLHGIPIIPVPPALRDDPWTMKRVYRDLGVTVAFHTPSYLRISQTQPFEGLRILMTGGEPPKYDDLLHHAGRLAFWNMYGPTETTIMITGGLLTPEHDPNAPLHTGRPIANSTVSIRRSDGSRVPPGASGELWLGGSGTVDGYLNRPELNAERFVSTPAGRFYRSGDYGRWNDEGELEIIGRIDQQIKLNGQRFELGEIEQTLCMHPAVAAACVAVETTGMDFKVLRAFVQPHHDAAPSESELAGFLSERLPVHMRPASIDIVAAIPVTPAGKVDRNALLAQGAMRPENLAGTASISTLEARIADIWADLFGRPVDRNDNFFALGGNSLLAVTMAHRLSESLGSKVLARSLFAAPKLADFAGRLNGQKNPSRHDGHSGDNRSVSEGEKEFWIAETAGLDTRTFTIPVHYRIIGELPFERLQAAWSAVLVRHGALKSCFRQNREGQPERCSAPATADTLEYAEVPDRKAALALIRKRQAQPLSMSVPPLWVAGMVRAADCGMQFFWLGIHHAIADGQSVGTLMEELAGFIDGRSVPPLREDDGGFAAREHAYLASAEAARDSAFWQERLMAMPVTAFAELPTDMPRSPDNPTGNHRMSAILDRQTAAGLKSLAQRNEASMHSLMTAILSMEAHRRGGHGQVIVGTPVSVRESASEAGMVAYGVNMLPLTIPVRPGQPFGMLLRTTQGIMAESLQHARYPFSLICRNFWNERPELRHPQRFPLFDLAVTENPYVPDDGGQQRFTRDIPQDAADWYEFTEASPGQDIVLIHEDLGQRGMFLQLQFNASVYSKATAERWFEAVTGWLRWFGEDPERSANPTPPLLASESERIGRWEQGIRAERPQLRVHELFEAIARRPGQGGRPAIAAPGAEISYAVLDRHANTIARLLADHGARRGKIVGVLTGRSPQLPAIILGIWKAGATYLPVAADLPEERQRFLLEDAGCSLLAADAATPVPEALRSMMPAIPLPDMFAGTRPPIPADRVATPGSPDDAAYIIYTSGSTGKPKGVAVSHTNLANLALGVSELLGITAEDRYLMFASPSFDVSLSDTVVPLLSGASICPVPEETIESPARFLAFLRESGVTVVDLTPAYLALFRNSGFPPSVRILVTGGEAPLPADIRKHAGKVRYFNAYGPTENTITSTMGELNASHADILSTGRPLPNTMVRILDEDGNPVPPGTAGEIWLGGAGVSMGYLNRPELNREKFIETPGGRFYRSGDLGRWLGDGTLEVIGRIDDQMKLNGIRIEPGEIEHTLSDHPAVAQAVVVQRSEKEGLKNLWAFVSLSPSCRTAAPEEWDRYLTGRLPANMLPSGVLVVEEIPMTATGKVDRSALLRLLEERPKADADLSAPEDDLERMIGDIWAEVFHRRRIHREDNFFNLGGHSLLAITVAHRIESVLGRPVPARHLFSEPTLAGFARKLREQVQAPKEMQDDSDAATIGQQEFWTAEKAGFSTGGFNMTLTLSVHRTGVTKEQWRSIWKRIAARHEALRTSFSEDESGRLRRVVAAEATDNFEILEAADEAGALALLRTRQTGPFSMSAPPLWRAGLARVAGNGREFLWLAMHHAIGDGLSLGILVGELSALMQDEPLDAAPPGFGIMAAAEERYFRSGQASTDAEYWKTAMDGLLDRHPETFEEWPLDRPRMNRREAATIRSSHCFRRTVDRKTVDGLKAMARRNEASMHALMLALAAHEVRRRTGRTGFVIGTSASTRQSVAESKTVGYCVNMLPLPCEPGGIETIDAMARAMQQTVAEAFQHARYPFASICRDFRQLHPEIRTHQSRFPLFDIAVTENPSLAADGGASILKAVKIDVQGAAADYSLQTNAPLQDFVLVHEEQPDGSIGLTWYADAALYSRDVARAWIDSIAGWMAFIAGCNGGAPVRLPKLLPGEMSLIRSWERGPRLPLPAKSLPGRFEQLAREMPDAPAIVTGHAERSYGEVSRSSSALARHLVQEGVGRGDSVCVYTSRSASLPETVMGIWKSGGCYVPLSNDLPPERLAFMMADCGARILIALDGIVVPAALETIAGTVVRLEEIDASEPAAEWKEPEPEERAYIIYTSGTTGNPKGVVLRHGGLINLGVAGAERLRIGSDDRVLMMASPSFDLWISDIASTWCTGAALVPVGKSLIEDTDGLRSTMARLGVTVGSMSPSYLRQFEGAGFPGLRTLMTVGEAPIPGDVARYAAMLDYVNGYGPTENTAASTIGRLCADAELIDAGTPIANTTLRILDGDGDPVPPGVCGEIWLSGPGVAEGYLGHAELTAEVFVDRPEGRSYRSGDRGRWLPSGTVQVLGRSDGQVKLRGQRVELGEIERRIESYPGVQHAVAIVLKRDDLSQVLRAAVTLSEGTEAPTQEQFTAYLAGSLPSWMIPSTVSVVGSMPLNASGKVDRRALEHIVASMVESVPEAGRQDGNGQQEPENAVERRIAEIWAEQLGHSPIGRNANFFELGGDSLKAIGTVNRLRHEFGCTVNDLYEHPVLWKFAMACRPQAGHVQAIVEHARKAWLEGIESRRAAERDRQECMGKLLESYRERNAGYAGRDLALRRPYRHILLTGATGYLGSYLLRELLADEALQVTVIVRQTGASAAERLDEAMAYYFGPAWNRAEGMGRRLSVLAGDLRQERLLLQPDEYDRLACSLDAVIHCAANVNHVGHYRDFRADNVDATGNLLRLAARRGQAPMDFHFVSTLSVAGAGRHGECTLFTEYDQAPAVRDANYYVRTKQEAESLVAASRGDLENASIYRVGNIGFSSDSAVLQRNIADNAFFRLLVALLGIGNVPDEMGAAISQVDIVARAIARLAGTASLSNEAHHIESPHRHRLSELLEVAEATRGMAKSCDFCTFMERLRDAAGDPGLEDAVAQAIDALGLRNEPPDDRPVRPTVACDRTNGLLGTMGIAWPDSLSAGLEAMMEKARLTAGAPSGRRI